MKKLFLIVTLFFQCFQCIVGSGGDERIVNGSNVTSQLYPWFTALINPQDPNKYFCGGVLIAPEFILTAAHCVEDFILQQVRIGAMEKTEGGEDPEDEAFNGGHKVELRNVSDIFLHPGYRINHPENDFGLIKLDQPTEKFLLDAAEIDGRFEKVTESYVGGEKLWAVGFGVSQIDILNSQFVRVFPDTLQHVELNYITNEKCREIIPKPVYSELIDEGIICTLTAQKDTCEGDSGGPLYDLTNNVVVGLTAYGNARCDGTYPSSYSKISNQYQWIKSTVCSNSDNATIPEWCGETVAPSTSFSPSNSPFPSSAISQQPSNLVCAPNESKVRLEINLDHIFYYEQTSWTLFNVCQLSTVATGDYKGFQLCLSSDDEFLFSINDSFGNGLGSTSVGSYKLYVNDNLIKDNQNFGFQESTLFGECVTETPTNRPSHSGECPEGKKLFILDLVPDNLPSETYWKVESCSGELLFDGGAAGYVTCLDDSKAYMYTITDSFGDGICCFEGEGSYTLSYDNELVRVGGVFKFIESTVFGDPTQFTGLCEPDPPSNPPSERISRCHDDNKLFEFDIVPDRFPTETEWLLQTCSGEIIASGGPSAYSTCLDGNIEYNFTITDSFGDGICCSLGEGKYTLRYNDDLIKEGGKFGSSESTFFGSIDIFGKTVYAPALNVCFKVEVFEKGKVRYVKGEKNCGPDKFAASSRISTLSRFSAIVNGTFAEFIPVKTHGYTGSIHFHINSGLEQGVLTMNTHNRTTKTFEADMYISNPC